MKKETISRLFALQSETIGIYVGKRKKMNYRKIPRHFHKSNHSKLYPDGKRVTQDSLQKERYVFGDISKMTGKVSLGARNPTDSDLRFIIGWCERALEFREFLKRKKK